MPPDPRSQHRRFWTAVYLVTFLVPELSGFVIKRGWLAHPTLSRIVKLWEGYDYVTRRFSPSKTSLERRSVITLGLIALWSHWVLGRP